jgi:hypothetical protein
MTKQTSQSSYLTLVPSNNTNVENYVEPADVCLLGIKDYFKYVTFYRRTQNAYQDLHHWRW